jgi:hypothetical protein
MPIPTPALPLKGREKAVLRITKMPIPTPALPLKGREKAVLRIT